MIGGERMPSKRFNALSEKVVVNTPTKNAKIIPVIQIATRGGLGTEEDPIREVLEYWDVKGNLLFVCDGAD